MSEQIQIEINKQIQENPVLLYMKGTPAQPQCGFSMRAVQALIACDKKFAYVDILANSQVRAELPKVSEWPTFPQLFVSGELVGGSDIIQEMLDSGELKELLDSLPEVAAEQ